MAASKPAELSRRLFGLGVMSLGVLSLALADFVPGQPIPKDFPHRAQLVYPIAAFLLLGGAGVIWRRTAAWAAAALTAWWLVVVVLMDGRMILRNADQYLAYSNTAEQLAILAAALIVFASCARLDWKLDAGAAGRLIRAGQIAFGACAVLFGGAHFFYMNLTAPLVPKWLPPSQLFWGYATGVFHILGGLAILSGIRARLAAILLTVMYAAFTPLVHIPLFLKDMHNHGNWAENATNLVLTGAAWVVADSLARRKKG